MLTNPNNQAAFDFGLIQAELREAVLRYEVAVDRADTAGQRAAMLKAAALAANLVETAWPGAGLEHPLVSMLRELDNLATGLGSDIFVVQRNRHRPAQTSGSDWRVLSSMAAAAVDFLMTGRGISATDARSRVAVLMSEAGVPTINGSRITARYVAELHKHGRGEGRAAMERQLTRLESIPGREATEDFIREFFAELARKLPKR